MQFFLKKFAYFGRRSLGAKSAHCQLGTENAALSTKGSYQGPHRSVEMVKPMAGLSRKHQLGLSKPRSVLSATRSLVIFC